MSPTLTAARGAPAARATLGTGGGDPPGGGTRARRSSRGRGSASSRIELQTEVTEDYPKFYNHREGPSSRMTFAFVSQSHVYLLALNSLTVGSMSV